MRRIVGVLLLAALATACSTSGESAKQTLTHPFPAFDRNDPAAAKRQFERIVKDDPGNKYAWYNLGVIAQAAHDTTTAAVDYSRAIHLDRRFESALYNLGILRYNAADYPAAIRLLRRAVDRNAQDANALWYLGLALRIPHTKATDREATHYLNAALRIDPALTRTLRPAGGSGGSGAG